MSKKNKRYMSPWIPKYRDHGDVCAWERIVLDGSECSIVEFCDVVSRSRGFVDTLGGAWVNIFTKKTFKTVEAAKEDTDKLLAKSGFEFLSQEQFEKLRILA